MRHEILCIAAHFQPKMILELKIGRQTDWLSSKRTCFNRQILSDVKITVVFVVAKVIFKQTISYVTKPKFYIWLHTVLCRSKMQGIKCWQGCIPRNKWIEFLNLLENGQPTTLHGTVSTHFVFVVVQSNNVIDDLIASDQGKMHRCHIEDMEMLLTWYYLIVIYVWFDVTGVYVCVSSMSDLEKVREKI